MSFLDTMNALPRIVAVREVQEGDTITLTPPVGKSSTFRVTIVNDLAVTGWAVHSKTGKELHQRKLFSRSWAEMSDITLVKRPS